MGNAIPLPMKTNAIANAFPGKHRLSSTDDTVFELTNALEVRAAREKNN